MIVSQSQRDRHLERIMEAMEGLPADQIHRERYRINLGREGSVEVDLGAIDPDKVLEFIFAQIFKQGREAGQEDVKAQMRGLLGVDESKWDI